MMLPSWKALSMKNFTLSMEDSTFKSHGRERSNQYLKQVIYIPFLDMPPTKPDTENDFGESTASDIFHWPKINHLYNWWEALPSGCSYNISKRRTDQNFFPRLGGMHSLMSFVGCLGDFLEGSGQAGLKTFYGVQSYCLEKKISPQWENFKTLGWRTTILDLHWKAGNGGTRWNFSCFKVLQ